MCFPLQCREQLEKLVYLQFRLQPVSSAFFAGIGKFLLLSLYESGRSVGPCPTATEAFMKQP